MTDIMQDFKNRRFTICPSYISRGLVEPRYGHLIVMSDFRYWSEHADDMLVWCNENGCQIRGMTVEVPDDQTLTLFCLRWR